MPLILRTALEAFLVERYYHWKVLGLSELELNLKTFVSELHPTQALPKSFILSLSS
jgi:hypothetical protein